MKSIAATTLLLALCAAAPLAATSFVMMEDSTLVDQADLVVRAHVLTRDDSPAEGTPSTDYLVEVDQVLAGNLPGSTLLVRVPGGTGPDGARLHVFGAPRFEPGQETVLFLRAGRNGAFRVLHLMLGAFYVVDHRGRELVLRNFAETHEVPHPEGSVDEEASARLRGPRQLDELAAWIADRDRGMEREPDYFLEMTPSESTALLDYFTLLGEDQGIRFRWFRFDQGQSVPFHVSTRDQPGLSVEQVRTGVRRGLNAWNAVTGANINLALAGTTGATAGLRFADGVNSFLFDDPSGDSGNSEFDEPFSCSEGGVLAIGGPRSNGIRSTFKGESFLHITEADIVTNKGIACFFDGSVDEVAAAAELFGHEVGHTLGIGHSSERSGEPSSVLREALMYFLIKNDGRGARLNSDDVTAARFLYGTGEIDPGPASGPAAPTGLVAEATSHTRVRLRWSDNATDEDGYQIQQRIQGSGAFQQVTGNFGPNLEEQVIQGLQPQTTYEFRVRAFNGEGASNSNVATATTPSGPPGAPANLRAEPLSATQIGLKWVDRSTDETQFMIQERSPRNDWRTLKVVQADVEETIVSNLVRDTPHTFRVRALNANGNSPASNEASATTLGVTGPCRQDGRSLCLLEDRFEVRVEFRDQFNGGNGVGRVQPVAGSDVSGLFWFFQPNNIELIVKMIDGRTLNDFFWTFYGALSTVEYWISVRDTETDQLATFHNPPDEICGLADTRSFPRESLGLEIPALRDSRPWAVGGLPLTHAGSPTPGLSTAILERGGATGTCEPGPQTLCLLDNRFQVEVSWMNPRPPMNNGVGTVAPVPSVDSDDTGFYWFFSPDNIELVVKVIDGQALNGNFWFFYGALTDVEYTIRVTDTVGGTSKTYRNEPFNLCGEADVNAF